MKRAERLVLVFAVVLLAVAAERNASQTEPGSDGPSSSAQRIAMVEWPRGRA